MGERRSSLGEFPIWLATRTRTSIMDEGSSSECLTAGSSRGDHACSASKGRPRARSRSLRCFPPDLEDPVRHASSDGSVSRTSVSGTRSTGLLSASHRSQRKTKPRGDRNKRLTCPTSTGLLDLRIAKSRVDCHQPLPDEGPPRKRPQFIVMSVITVTPARKPLTYTVFLVTLTMTMT